MQKNDSLYTYERLYVLQDEVAGDVAWQVLAKLGY